MKKTAVFHKKHSSLLLFELFKSYFSGKELQDLWKQQEGEENTM